MTNTTMLPNQAKPVRRSHATASAREVKPSGIFGNMLGTLGGSIACQAACGGNRACIDACGLAAQTAGSLIPI